MRRLTNSLVAVLAAFCALVAVSILLGLVLVVARRGVPALSWSFFTEQIRLVGASGGIFWNLIGTGILLATAFVVCTPLAVGLALLERVWLRAGAARRGVR